MKKCLSLIIAAVMLLAMVPAMAWNLTSDPVDYTISTAADLQAFADAVNGGNDFSGKTITLANDIDLGGATWTPIGTSGHYFKGEFNGANHTISNFKIDATVLDTASAQYFGFFAQLGSGSNVHDLTLSDVTITVKITAGTEKSTWLGTLAGRVDGTVTNVTVRNVTATVSGGGTKTSFVSGLCGYLNLPTSKVTNCTVESFKIETASPTDIKYFGFGGFAGALSGSGTLNGNTVKKFTVDVKTIANSEIAVGGIASQTQTSGNSIIINNFNVSDLDITVHGAGGTESIRVGGLVGVPGAQTTISNSSVSGKITAKEASANTTRVGGFMGDLGWSSGSNHKITNSSTNVSIDAGNAIAGGFVGSAAHSNNNNNARPISFENCSAAGSISGQDGIIGGLIGTVANGQQVTLTNNKNNTTVSKDIGNQDEGATVTGVSATPSILDFGSHTLGSDYASKSLETTIKNLGKENIPVFLFPSAEFNKYFEYEEINPNPSANPSTDPVDTPPSDPVIAANVSDPDMAMNRGRGVDDDGLGAGGDSASLGTLKLRVKPKAGLPAGSYSGDIEIKNSDGTETLATVTAKITITAPSSSGIDLWYIRGNSFGSSKSAAPTSVEIDGQPVSFVGDGREFTVSCLKPDSKWITAKWNSTSVTISFTPDASAYCSTVAIPKTGDMPLFATIAAWLGF